MYFKLSLHNCDNKARNRSGSHESGPCLNPYLDPASALALIFISVSRPCQTGWFFLIMARQSTGPALTQPVCRAMSLRAARWQSGYAAVCKTVYIGSIPVRASNLSDYVGLFDYVGPADYVGIVCCGIDCRTYMLGTSGSGHATPTGIRCGGINGNCHRCRNL